MSPDRKWSPTEIVSLAESFRFPPLRTIQDAIKEEVIRRRLVHKPWQFAIRKGERSYVTPYQNLTQQIQWNSLMVVIPLWLPGVALVVVAGVPLVLCVRRVRRRRRLGECLECGYNLTHNVSGICPECGGAVRESQSSGAG